VRTAVLRVRTPAGAWGQELPFLGVLRWRRPGREQELVEEAVEARLTFADVAGIIPTLADAREVAAAWQAHLIRRATELNREGAFAEVQRLGEEELPRLRAYCAFHPETGRYAHDVERLYDRAVLPLEERPLKEMALAMHKRVHAEPDLRLRSLPSWTEFIDD
jgi:hypothetical protein